MNAINFMILAHGPIIPWMLGYTYGVMLFPFSGLGVIVGVKWGRAGRSGRERDDTSSSSLGNVWLLFCACLITAVVPPFVYMLLRTVGPLFFFGSAVACFAINVFLARASVRRREAAEQPRGEQTAAGDGETHED